jgi:hypothetical protein
MTKLLDEGLQGERVVCFLLGNWALVQESSH